MINGTEEENSPALPNQARTFTTLWESLTLMSDTEKTAFYKA